MVLILVTLNLGIDDTALNFNGPVPTLLNCISPTQKVTLVHALKKISTRATAIPNRNNRTLSIRYMHIAFCWFSLWSAFSDAGIGAFVRARSILPNSILAILAILAFMAI